jgi:hypothetical protein
MQEGGGYYVAALCVVAMATVFWLFQKAMDARILDLKARVDRAEAELAKKDQALEALHAKVDARQERLTRDVESVIEVQKALDKALGRAQRRAPKEGDAP